MAAPTTPASTSFQLRSLYRSILRELPIRTTRTPSPLRKRMHEIFSSPAQQQQGQGQASATTDNLRRQIQEGEQFVQFAKAQRMYAMLLDRYNPGMEMDDEERVRLTARRVGMDLPDEVDLSEKEEGGEGMGEGEGGKKE